MNKFLPIFMILLFGCSTASEIPKDGIYDYRIEFAEFGEGAMTMSCKVEFTRDSVYVTLTEDSFLGSKKDTLEAGKLVKHKESGHWIIAHNDEDKTAEEVGGCSGGPSVIDIEKNIYWMC